MAASTPQQGDAPKTLCTAYIKGLSEKLRRSGPLWALSHGHMKSVWRIHMRTKPVSKPASVKVVRNWFQNWFKVGYVKGLCGSEACLQTNEYYEKRPNASEEQDPRAEADRSCVRGSFKDCPEGYVGETKRTLKVRMSEHRQAVRRGDPKNSIAVNFQRTNHCINWDGATVQKTNRRFRQRRTVEAIQIRKSISNMNLDSGLLLPMVWNAILNPPQTHTT